jgi:hypothetical protein
MQCVEIGKDESGESRGRDNAESDVDIVGSDAEIGPLAFTDAEVGALEDELTTEYADGLVPLRDAKNLMVLAV